MKKESYEIHVTIDAMDREAQWKKFCIAEGIKPLCIQMPCGDHPRQVMCAVQITDTETAARHLMEMLIRDAEKAGFRVLRVKLEAPLAESEPNDPMQYYECHIKVWQPEYESPCEARSFQEMAEKMGFALSRDLWSSTDDQIRHFLTTRWRGAPNPKAAQGWFQALLDETHLLLPEATMHTERVIFDSNPKLDAGWIG